LPGKESKMAELFGSIATVLAVVGVVLNNRLNRICFGLWLVSNAICAGLHISVGLWSMVIRDIIFIALACEGWFRWRKKGIG